MNTTLLVAILTVSASVVINGVGIWAARESREKIRLESKKLNVEYWEGVAADLRKEMAASRAEYEKRAIRLGDAFEYLCEQVAHDYPEAVKIARQISEGRIQFKRPIDPTEEHD